MEVYIVTACCIDKTSRSPHADAPTVTVVCANLVIPLPCLLTCDLPEVALGTPTGWLTIGVKKSGTNTMGAIVIALVIAIPI